MTGDFLQTLLFVKLFFAELFFVDTGFETGILQRLQNSLTVFVTGGLNRHL